MKNAKMEIIRFDAQDVITTSGGPVLGYFAGTVVDTRRIAFNTFVNSGGMYLLGAVGGKSQYIRTENLNKEQSNYYIINSATYDNANYYELDAGRASEAPTGSGYEYLEDAAEILAWLQSLTANQ